MSRARKPTALLELSGTLADHPSRYANRLNEPQLTQGIGNPPNHLSEQEKVVWQELARDIYWLKVSDRLSMEIVCRLTSKMRNDPNFKTMEFSVLTTLLRSLGMTPTDRSRVNAPVSIEYRDEWHELLT